MYKYRTSSRNFKRLHQRQLTSDEKSVLNRNKTQLALQWADDLKIGHCLTWFIRHQDLITGFIYEKTGDDSYNLHYTRVWRLRGVKDQNSSAAKNNLKYTVTKNNTEGFVKDLMTSFKERKIYPKIIHLFNSIQQSQEFIASNSKRLLKNI